MNINPTAPLTVVISRDNGEEQANTDLVAVKEGHTIVKTGATEMYFHALRLAITQDPDLIKKINVYYDDGDCNLIGPLNLKDSVAWPVGFLNEAWDIEMRIGDAKREKEQP